jgi:hypothetical protein
MAEVRTGTPVLTSAAFSPPAIIRATASVGFDEKQFRHTRLGAAAHHRSRNPPLAKQVCMEARDLQTRELKPVARNRVQTSTSSVTTELP